MRGLDPESTVGPLGLNVYLGLGISEFVLQTPTVGDGDLEAIRLFAETIIPAFR